ncbi:MAG: XisH family protein [Bacteroidota bacterium]
MPAKDKFHDHVINALQVEGWTITHDPYFLRLGRRKGYIDLGAERSFIGAERENEKIAVEIKSFLSPSSLDQFEDALGQFLIYRPALTKAEPARVLFLAVPKTFYEDFFDEPYFVEIAELYDLKMCIFNESETELIWVKQSNTKRKL